MQRDANGNWNPSAIVQKWNTESNTNRASHPFMLTNGGDRWLKYIERKIPDQNVRNELYSKLLERYKQKAAQGLPLNKWDMKVIEQELKSKYQSSGKIPMFFDISGMAFNKTMAGMVTDALSGQTPTVNNPADNTSAQTQPVQQAQQPAQQAQQTQQAQQPKRWTYDDFYRTVGDDAVKGREWLKAHPWYKVGTKTQQWLDTHPLPAKQSVNNQGTGATGQGGATVTPVNQNYNVAM